MISLTKVIQKKILLILSVSSVFSFAGCYFVKDIVTTQYKHEIVPEYRRSLKEVVISLSTGDSDLSLQKELLNTFPLYTKVYLLLPQSIKSKILKHLDDTGQRKIELCPFEDKYMQSGGLYMLFPERDKLQYVTLTKKTMSNPGTVWAQDLFEFAYSEKNKNIFIISDVYKWFSSIENKSKALVQSDNEYLNALTSRNKNILRSEVTFAGGNVFVDEIKGKKVLLCGGDILRKTKAVWRGTKNRRFSRRKAISILKKTFGVDEVVVVGAEMVQPAHMFHLDQAMTLLEGGIAAVTNVIGPLPEKADQQARILEVESFLVELRETLRKLGYKVINVDTSVDKILSYKYEVNMIPYVDMKTNEKTVLMPVFGGNEFEQIIEKRNQAIIKSLGYKIILVKSNAYKSNGGLHCLVNVLK